MELRAGRSKWTGAHGGCLLLLCEGPFETDDVFFARAESSESRDRRLDQQPRLRQLLVRRLGQAEHERQRSKNRFVVDCRDKGAAVGPAADAEDAELLQ